MSYTASLRARKLEQTLEDYLSSTYAPFLSGIESVFGFSEPCSLYGGRLYQRQISDKEISKLRQKGIYYRIPLTTHYFDERTYESAKPFLQKHNIQGNTVIVANHDLGALIRKDFTNYKIELSVINELRTIEEVNHFTKIYDEVVLHGLWNNKTEELKRIKDKDKIRLFAAMACAYNCPDKVCYKNCSQINSGIIKERVKPCSKSYLKRENLGIVTFNSDKLRALGFSWFKLLPIAINTKIFKAREV